MEKETAEVYVEAVTNIAYANNVFRITFSQQEAGNKHREMVKLLVPANQVNNILTQIAKGAREISTGIRAKQANPKVTVEDNTPAPAAVSKERGGKRR